MSFLENRAKDSMDLSDEVIAKTMLTSSMASATAYLNALLTSSTPEVRALYASSLSQIISENAALTELGVKREWGHPYSEPREQLSAVYGKVESAMRHMQQQ